MDNVNRRVDARGVGRKLLSVCVPTFNEQDNVDLLYDRVKHVMDPIADRYDFELIFTDNHSDDRTFERITALAHSDPRVRGIRFSRNFGFQRSILANFRSARGDAAVQLDCDLQDPPELIPTFLALWEQGYKVVYGIRRARPRESRWLYLSRKLFYRMIDFLSEDELPHDAGDFRLIDRRILDELRRVDEGNPYLRGIIATMGFRQMGVPYDRAARIAGSSKFDLPRLVGLAMDGVLQHSIVPLRLATILGTIMFVVSLAGALYYLLAKLLLPTDWPAGFASTTLLILFSTAANALLLGIIGEYIGRIYKSVKKPNLVIVESIVDAAGEPDSQATGLVCPEDARLPAERIGTFRSGPLIGHRSGE
jgi:dolichol-phosphate mannosyltransferase